jgi:putative ABC transport system substrate-binding protein
MERRTFLGVITGGLLAAPLVAETEQARRVYVVGILASGATNPFLQSFRQGLHDLGYVEGQNLVVEARYHAGNPDRLPALAAELVGLKVDVILALSSTEVRAAKQATRTIPIVFAVHNDPVGTGDVVSLAHPGGNITGTTQMATELSAKQLELLHETVPGITRVAVVWNPTTPSHGPALKQTEAAVRRLGMQLSKIEARSGSELDGAYTTAAREHAGAVLLLASPMAVEEHDRVASVAAKHRLATMYGSRLFVDAGGLISYGPDLSDLARRAAVYVDKILKGAKPGELPVEQAVKFELVINLKTAKTLGLTIPPSLLQRADQVIE